MNSTTTSGAHKSYTIDYKFSEDTNKKIDKQILEIKSRFGGEPVYSKIAAIESICLFLSRWKYRLTSGLYFDVKYFCQRLFRGFDDLDKWNAAWYISRKAIPVLTAWRNGKIMGTSVKRHLENRHGEIIELSDDKIILDGNEAPEAFTEEEWKAIIDDIIFSFKFVINDDSLDIDYSSESYKVSYKRYKRGMKLFSIYFYSLWD